ncbi:uncharacterized protein LOC143083478 [Mytilus galloprovincialis]|uniref:uncharacterized protein LOC143083478 n=1 Tax=Mytilus galloprovincialis TaxID=29158 RepID=UPI003F7B9C64
MATSFQNCGVCELRHITNPSIVWCTECDEGLCTECQEHHSLSKASRRHSVIPITGYQKLPTNLLKVTQYCSKHNEKYQIYCQMHESPCCSKCIVEDHKDCQDIVNLDDVIHNVKTSNALLEIEDTLVEAAENIQKIRQHQQDNLSTLYEKRKEIENEIKNIRIKINSHLDKLQEDLLKQLYSIEEKENLKICQLLSKLEHKEKEIKEYQRNIMNIKQQATDLQVFLSMKQIKEGVYSKGIFLHSIIEGEEGHCFSYEINPSIQNIMSDIESFGEVNIEAKHCDIVLTKKKAKQAQVMVPQLTVQSRSIRNIKLTIHKIINTKENVFSCCILPDDRTVFTFFIESTVKVFNNKGLKGFKVKMPCEPFDIVYISQDNTLAVTSGGSEKNCITIIDLARKKIRKIITLDSHNYGIALKDNRLIYSGYDKGICMINMYDESTRDIHDIVKDAMPSESYIATLRDNIYYTNNVTNVVTCCNLKGEIQWTFQNESVLKSPRGIDVDSDGNVYVVGILSNNVVVISPDGQLHSEILTAADGLNRPSSLHYSEPRNQLLVAGYNDKAHLFDFI